MSVDEIYYIHPLVYASRAEIVQTGSWDTPRNAKVVDVLIGSNAMIYISSLLWQMGRRICWL